MGKMGRMGRMGRMERRGGDGAESGRIWEEAARKVGGCEKQGGGSGEPAVRGGRVEEGRRRNDAGRGEEEVVVEGAREKERAVRRGGRLGRKEKMATPHPIDKTRGAVPRGTAPARITCNLITR